MAGLLAYPAGVVFFPFTWYFNYISDVPLSAIVVVLLSVQMILRRMGDFAATSVPSTSSLCSALSIGQDADFVGYLTLWFWT